jgi:hypothetical protein
MTKARMRKAREAFPLGHPLIGVAHGIADHGDGSRYDEIAAALFVASKDAEKRHRAFLGDLRRRLLAGWPADPQQPVLWALDVLNRLERERPVAPE